MITKNTPVTRMDAGLERASFSLRNVTLALAFVLLPYAAMSGILLLGR